ncbi:MAG: PD-(D/E)XK nuclease family protein, partial [Nanoarchaeota archaeon]|nr:PD-(D/E)XK nuclease family protein [Nanoarchaeota archaeon]
MDKWSYSKINTANYCTFQFFLKYIHPKKPKPLRLSAYVKGSLLHDQIDKFWNRLGTSEETAKKSSKKKYSNAEEFARYTQGKWKRIVVADKHSETKIHWRFNEEKWQILNQLPKICVPLFYELSKEGPPLFSELPFDFMYENKRFIGRIDEVRVRDGKIVVRDFKSGKPWLGEMKLKYDPQLTLYNAGLYSLISSDNIFAGKLGLKSDSFPKYQIPICSDFEMEFFLIESLPIL